MTRSALALLAMAPAVTGCGADTQIFAGALHPEAGTCDVVNRATLQRHGTVVQFTPQDGVMTLDGTLSPTGHIEAAQQTLGMDRKPYRLSFSGQLTSDTIAGAYVTPRCRYSVILKATGS